MINIGSLISNYVVVAVAGSYVLAANGAAPSPYAVWTLDSDGDGVHNGRYFTDRMDAEWEFCSLAFEWFQDNVIISDEEDEEYKRSSAEARVEAIEENLSAAHRSLTAAMDLVEDMFKEWDRLCPKEDRVTDEPVDKVVREFVEDFQNMINVNSLDPFTAAIAILSDLKKRQYQRGKVLYDILNTL